MKSPLTLSVAVLAVLGSGAWAQVPIGPIRAAQPTIQVFNNTDGLVRFTISSGAAVQSGEIQPGQSRPVQFEPVNRARVLTVFSVPNFALLSSRQVELTAGNYYLARPEGESPKLPVDRGLKERPGKVKQSPPAEPAPKPAEDTPKAPEKTPKPAQKTPKT
jgi:hypothetical protein